MSGFFFCGITLEVDANLSESSINENSDVDQMIKSSAILLKFVIRIEICPTYSAAKSRDPVASMEFSIKPLNPAFWQYFVCQCASLFLQLVQLLMVIRLLCHK